MSIGGIKMAKVKINGYDVELSMDELKELVKEPIKSKVEEFKEVIAQAKKVVTPPVLLTPDYQVTPRNIMTGLVMTNIKGRKNMKWTNKEYAQLKELFEEGKSDKVIGKIMDRTETAITNIRSELKLSRHHQTPTKWKRIDNTKTVMPLVNKNHGWNHNNIEVLKALFSEGLTDKQIGRQMGRTTAGIKSQRHKSGLVHQKVEQVMAPTHLVQVMAPTHLVQDKQPRKILNLSPERRAKLSWICKRTNNLRNSGLGNSESMKQAKKDWETFITTGGTQ
jgi:hypothetical protein